MQNNLVTVDVLKEIHLGYREKLITEREIKNDITPIFWRGIRQKIIKGECLQIGIKAQTTKGKSTLGQHIKLIINQIILELSQQQKIQKTTYKGEEQEYELIASNQLDFTRITRRKDLYQVCTLIDEYLDMARSGNNATIEANLLETYNKVCAQNYLHRIQCTPESDYDDQSLLILSIVDTDKKKGITKCKLYYRDPTEKINQLLGYVTFNVTETLTKNWYKKYRIKKQFAMDLITQQGIPDVRPLEISLTTLITYKNCENWAKIGILNPDVIGTKVDTIAQEIKAIYSIVSKMDIISKIKALMIPVIEIVNAQDQLNKPRRIPLNLVQQARLKTRIEILQKEHMELIKHHQRLIKLYKDYISIDEDNQINEINTLIQKYKLLEEVKPYE